MHKKLLKKFICIFTIFISNHIFATEWIFDVILNEEIIGQHSFNYENTKTTSQANFEFKYFLFNFKYVHKSTEIWKKNCLISISSQTNDDGDLFKVDGFQNKDNFLVSTIKNTFKLPLCVMTFSYGNPNILKQNKLMNSQTGELIDVNISFIKKEIYTVRGNNVLANLWKIQTINPENDLLIYLWYDDEMNWLGLKTDTPIGFMHYRLR